MRKFFISWIISIISILSIGQKLQPFYFENKIPQYDINKSKPILQQNNSYSSNTDIIFQKLDLTIDPAIYFISGSVTSYFKALSNINSISFDMSDSLIVDSIIYHSQKLTFQHSDNIIEIDLPNIVTINTTDSIEVFYHGMPVGSGTYSFRQNYHNGIPIIFTHSEPYGSKYWWPCRQNLSDKIDSIEIIITTPSTYTAIANGLLEKVTGNANRTFYWKHHYPITTYLVAFSVTEYEFYIDTTILDNGDIIEIHNYIYPEVVDSIKNLTKVTIPIMKFYCERFGTYPFINEKYGHAQTSLNGGMENQTISFMGYFHFSLIAHELAHSWFGDYITCKSWQDIWLNEAFATYLAGLCYEEFGNEEAWNELKTSYKNNITEFVGGSVWVDDTTYESRIFSHRLSYEKGAYLLHMLRWELGDSIFFQAIRNYLNDDELANNFATTSDLIKHFEQVADTSLDEFINDWYYGEGFPIYNILWNVYEDNSVSIHIFQQPSHPSVDFFEMHLPIAFYGINKDTVIRIHHIENGQEINFCFDFPVINVALDPDLWILTNYTNISYNNTDQEIFHLYPNPFSDEIFILSLQISEIENISIFTTSGHKIYSIDKNPGVIQTSHFPKGMYIIQIKTSNHTIKKKLIKID